MGQVLFGLWAIVAFASFVWIGGVFGRIIDQKPPLSRRLRRLTVATMVFLAIPLGYEFAGPCTLPVALLADNQIEARPNGMFCWEFGQGYSAIPYNRTLVSGGVRVITENPKVREIRYDLNARVIDLNAWFSQPDRKKLKSISYSPDSFDTTWTKFYQQTTPTVNMEIGKVVIRLLFEFNEAHSRDLARFYNPLDPQQNEDLKQLLEPWLNERLATDGLQVSYDGFSIE